MRLYSISQTVLGERTCKVCGGLDGKRFKLSEKQEGVNFPPVHPNCRCTTIGYDPDDDIAELENKQEQLSYEEWYQQYVEGREQKRIESNDTVAVELPSGSPKPVPVSTENTIDISAESGIIDNIRLPAEIYGIESMSNETRQAISDAVEKLTSEYDIHIAGVQITDLGARYKNVPFQYQHFIENDTLVHKLFINSGYYFNDTQEEFQARILRNYRNGVLASKTVEDLIAHEMAHIMTFQSVSTEGGWLLENRRLSDLCFPGVSLYADVSGDGAETIAEGFVRMRNGEPIPDNVHELITEYIERWKK